MKSQGVVVERDGHQGGWRVCVQRRGRSSSRVFENILWNKPTRRTTLFCKQARRGNTDQMQPRKLASAWHSPCAWYPSPQGCVVQSVRQGRWRLAQALFPRLAWLAVRVTVVIEPRLDARTYTCTKHTYTRTYTQEMLYPTQEIIQCRSEWRESNEGLEISHVPPRHDETCPSSETRGDCQIAIHRMKRRSLTKATRYGSTRSKATPS